MAKTNEHSGGSHSGQFALVYFGLVACAVGLVSTGVELWRSPAMWYRHLLGAITSIGVGLILVARLVRGRRVVLARVLVAASLALFAVLLFLRLR